MTIEILTVIAALCSSNNFDIQRNCQKKLLNCIETYYATAKPELLAFGVSQCIRNDRSNGIFKGWW